MYQLTLRRRFDLCRDRLAIARSGRQRGTLGLSQERITKVLIEPLSTLAALLLIEHSLTGIGFPAGQVLVLAEFLIFQSRGVQLIDLFVGDRLEIVGFFFSLAFSSRLIRRSWARSLPA